MLVIGYDATYALKLASAMSVALCVGGALVLKPCVVGANKNGTEKDEKNWKDIVVNRSKFIVVMDIAGSAFALLHSFLTRGTDEQDIPFLLAVTATQQIIPFQFGIATQEKYSNYIQVFWSVFCYTRGAMTFLFAFSRLAVHRSKEVIKKHDP